jgi:hypothetical protein
VLQVSLSPTLVAQNSPKLSVDVAAGRHPINPDIYGIASYGLDANFAKEIRVPNVRWGGDATTRYNWQADSSNSGFDWYFMGGSEVANPTPSGGVDAMVSTYATAGALSLVTVPIIPYVNKSSTVTCSFPVSVYGPQQSVNPYVHPNGDDCGNSIAANGTQLIDKDIYMNHLDNTVSLEKGWIQHLVSTFGTAANGGVPCYELDNEPGGWGNTHRDVLPNGATYDTIITLGTQYAVMIKEVDPSAKILGPGDFTLGGWIGTPDQQGGLYAGEYYLQKMSAYEKQNGRRILDYFDEHFYGGGGTDESELASTRALWDPSFNSGTWVEQYYLGNMQLIPRFKQWIAQHYPGSKLSFSEYSFTCDDCAGTKSPITNALAQADVLGIFGREGLDLANLWSVPKPTDPLAYSYRLYRNYDGRGGQYGDTWVQSSSSDQGQLAIYGAQRTSDGALTLVIINKTSNAIQTSVSTANFNPAATAAVYSYSNADLTRIVHGKDIPVSSGAISYTFPAHSATPVRAIAINAEGDRCGVSAFGHRAGIHYRIYSSEHRWRRTGG